MNRPGVVFSREQLLNAAWDRTRAITDRAVDVYVLRCRQKVEHDPRHTDPDPLGGADSRYTFEPRRAMATT